MVGAAACCGLTCHDGGNPEGSHPLPPMPTNTRPSDWTPERLDRLARALLPVVFGRPAPVKTQRRKPQAAPVARIATAGAALSRNAIRGYATWRRA